MNNNNASSNNSVGPVPSLSLHLTTTRCDVRYRHSRTSEQQHHLVTWFIAESACVSSEPDRECVSPSECGSVFLSLSPSVSVRECVSLCPSLCLYVSMCGTKSSTRIRNLRIGCRWVLALCVAWLCLCVWDSVSLVRCVGSVCVCPARWVWFFVCVCVCLYVCVCVDDRECDRLVRRPVHRFTPLDVVTGVCWLPIFHLASQSRIIFRKLRIIFRTCNFSELT